MKTPQWQQILLNQKNWRTQKIGSLIQIHFMTDRDSFPLTQARKWFATHYNVEVCAAFFNPTRWLFNKTMRRHEAFFSVSETDFAHITRSAVDFTGWLDATEKKP